MCRLHTQYYEIAHNGLLVKGMDNIHCWSKRDNQADGTCHYFPHMPINITCWREIWV